MEHVLEWGLDVIRAIQTIASPGLTVAMKILTTAGTEYFYLLFLPIIFWCVDEKGGARLGLVFIFSSFVNGWLKTAFGQPRPYDLDPALGMARETSHGLPSGHAQGSSTFWGMAAPMVRRPWGLVLAIALPLLISFTRLYLGVHFPTDVFLGLALGWGFALLSWGFGAKLETMIARWDIRVQILVAAALALGMNALHMEDTSMPGAFFGTAVGAAFLFRRPRFDASSGSLAKKAARFSLGGAIMAVIYVGGKLAFPGEGSPSYALWRFLRYGLIGVWISLGAPWLFLRLKLADRRDPERTAAD